MEDKGGPTPPHAPGARVPPPPPPPPPVLPAAVSTPAAGPPAPHPPLRRPAAAGAPARAASPPLLAPRKCSSETQGPRGRPSAARCGGACTGVGAGRPAGLLSASVCRVMRAQVELNAGVAPHLAGLPHSRRGAGLLVADGALRRSRGVQAAPAWHPTTLDPGLRPNPCFPRSPLQPPPALRQLAGVAGQRGSQAGQQRAATVSSGWRRRQRGKPSHKGQIARNARCDGRQRYS